MTRKDFELLADSLRANHCPIKVVIALADDIEKVYGRFDKEVFIKRATGITLWKEQHNDDEH